MKVILSLFLAISALGAYADTKVIYFGGSGATERNLACWRASAEAQRPGISFEVHGYPGGDYRDSNVIARNGHGAIAAVVSEIRSHPETHFIIVGHSSGSAEANAVADLVALNGNAKQMELINLEGFTTPSWISRRVRTRCFYAHNASGVPTRGERSMRGCDTVSELTNTYCTSKLCNHFSVVNVGGGRYGSCSANLAWLPQLSVPVQSAASSSVVTR